MSYGGQLVRDLLETEDYILLNNLNIVEGVDAGPWTWVNRAKEKVNSCLDLAIISRNLEPFVRKVIVDTARNFTPLRVLTKSRSYTDHFSYKVVLRMPSAKAEVKVRENAWNLRKPGGWEVYKEKH